MIGGIAGTKIANLRPTITDSTWVPGLSSNPTQRKLWVGLIFVPSDSSGNVLMRDVGDAGAGTEISVGQQIPLYDFDPATVEFQGAAAGAVVTVSGTWAS